MWENTPPSFTNRGELTSLFPNLGPFKKIPRVSQEGISGERALFFRHTGGRKKGPLQITRRKPYSPEKGLPPKSVHSPRVVTPRIISPAAGINHRGGLPTTGLLFCHQKEPRHVLPTQPARAPRRRLTRSFEGYLFLVETRTSQRMVPPPAPQPTE